MIAERNGEFAVSASAANAISVTVDLSEGIDVESEGGEAGEGREVDEAEAALQRQIAQLENEGGMEDDIETDALTESQLEVFRQQEARLHALR